jgi:hypothetical protein
VEGKMTEYNGHVIENMIITIRNKKVILDSALARLYGVKTKRLNEQVRRNAERFPADFMFQLTEQELKHLKSQIAASRLQDFTKQEDTSNRPQIATGSQKHRDPRFRPYAFTEHGAIMAANVLNSRQAIEMSVFVVRAFIKMREQFLDRAELQKRLAEIEKLLISHDAALRDIYQKIRPLLLPPPEPQRKQIGFEVREKRSNYKAVMKRP